ncbi:hypothetical protein [Streptomyces sp. WAC00263]|uniref:hypothetical protein n=1 Tax=Streptomyces sp. WAC00263 TaxID=1917422 RepID=UPI0015EECDA1|nr:hypothetical protein [Streptomyces sp. WAC00263]
MTRHRLAVWTTLAALSFTVLLVLAFAPADGHAAGGGRDGSAGPTRVAAVRALGAPHLRLAAGGRISGARGTAAVARTALGGPVAAYGALLCGLFGLATAGVLWSLRAGGHRSPPQRAERAVAAARQHASGSRPVERSGREASHALRWLLRLGPAAAGAPTGRGASPARATSPCSVTGRPSW